MTLMTQESGGLKRGLRGRDGAIVRTQGIPPAPVSCNQSDGRPTAAAPAITCRYRREGSP
jgi:hypothetical protein